MSFNHKALVPLIVLATIGLGGAPAHGQRGGGERSTVDRPIGGLPDLPTIPGSRNGPDTGPTTGPIIGPLIGRDFGLARELQRKMSPVSAIMVPDLSSGDLIEVATRFSVDCRTGNARACLLADAYARAGTAIRTASLQCDSAAARYLPAYASGTPAREIARDFDLSCLGSFALRKSGNLAEVPQPRPSLLADAEASGGLLGAIGLLEFDGTTICAGLLRQGGRFLTARHCLDGVPVSRLSVRAAMGTNAPWRVKVTRQGDPDNPGAAADWIELELGGPGLPDPPRTNLVRLTQPSAVTLVASYPQFADTDYANPSEPLPRRALRFPLDRTCQALVAQAGCLQIACESVRGFSGAPIFSNRRADGSFDVVGLISGNNGNSIGCVAQSVRNLTFAPSGEVIATSAAR